MTPLEALHALDDLLIEEEVALLGANIKAVVALGSTKAELLTRLEDTPIDADSIEPDFVKQVRRKAEENLFLLRHLRGCLQVVNSDTGFAQSTYGRDGQELSRSGGLSLTHI